MNPTVTPLNVTSSGVLTSLSGFMAQVYGWMTLGLALTAITAFFATYTQFGVDLVTSPFIFILLILELVIVIGLSAAAQRLHPLIAGGLFMAYAIINGLFFAGILAEFTYSSIFEAFAATAGTFAIMSIYGAVTKADLTRWGNLAFMALLGLLFGLVLNIFFQSDALTWLLTFVGIGIFIVLIAVDTQKLKKFAQLGEANGAMASYAIRGALALYLDFVNLFVRLMYVFGRRK